MSRLDFTRWWLRQRTDAWSYFSPDAPDAALDLFDRLSTELAWERRSDAPRGECWLTPLDVPYTYGRGRGTRTYLPHPFTASVIEVLDLIQAQVHDLNGSDPSAFGIVPPNCCFANSYENARDHLGWHADDSPEMSHDSAIYSVSFGAPRVIEIRDNKTETVERILLEHGSIFAMHAGVQRTHMHRVPKSSAQCGRRISLTYRTLV